MGKSVVLMNLTEEGVKDIKNAPERIKDGIKLYESMGGKLLGFYMVMGDYDYVAIGESPDDETAAAFMMALSSGGNVRTKTMKAFDMEEMAAILKKIPG